MIYTGKSKCTKQFLTVLFILGCLFYLIVSRYSWADNNPINITKLNIIPQPRQVVTSSKSPACVLDNEWTVLVESTADETTRLSAELITKDLNEIWGLKVALLVDDKALASTKKSIILGITKRDKKIDAIATQKAIALNPDLHPQGYKVSITPDWPRPGKILLLANTSQGLFYAAQTFRQLITKDTANQIILPPFVVDDWPLFDYRGVQINITNNIKTDYIKNLIHLLSFYKMNILSIQTSYLTDEQIAELAKEASAYQINLVGNISMIKPGSSHHICPDKERCGHLNKKPLGWADSVLKEQRFLSRIPKTTIVMNPALGGDREQSPIERCETNTFEQNNTNNISNYYEQIESFRREGLEQIICPRITVNGDILPDILAVRKTIYTASQAGLRHLDNNHPIMGLMLCGTLEKTTTFPETLIEPIAFTAECGWMPDRVDADKFNSNLTHSLFGINGNEGAEITNLLSSCNQLVSGNNLSNLIFTDPFKSEIHLDTPNFYGSLKKIKSISNEALKKITSLQEKSRRSKEVLDVWRYAASQWQAFAERFLTARDISNKHQNYYDERYVFEYAPIEADYQATNKDYEELFGQTSKRFDTLQEEYQKLISRRYDTAETKAVEPFAPIEVTANDTKNITKTPITPPTTSLTWFESTKTLWQDKKKRVTDAFVSGNFLSPEELGIELAKLPQRLVTPAIKPPNLEIGKTFTWWDRRLNYRVLVTMENTVARPTIGQEAFAYPVEIKFNFTELLKESVITRAALVDMAFDPQSVQVIEYSKEGTPLAEVPFQMDETRQFDSRFPARGGSAFGGNAEVNLVWIIRKPIEVKTTKYFCVYFDTTKSQTPKYKVKYPYGGLSTSGTDKKGYWLKNGRLKVGTSLPSKNNILNSSFINSWVVRGFSTGFFTRLNLIESKKEGFGAIREIGTAGGLLLQNQADGPLLSRFHAVSKDGDGYLFNFYENLPICEVFTDSRINEFHNSYLIPQSYLAAALKDRMSAFSGAEYLSSNYTKRKISLTQPLNTSFNDSFWLAQKIVKGLTIASITPDNSVTHYLKTTPEDSNISISFGVSGNKPLHHFILYADTTQQDTFELMNQIKNIFTLDNMPVIQRNRAERLSP